MSADVFRRCYFLSCPVENHVGVLFSLRSCALHSSPDCFFPPLIILTHSSLTSLLFPIAIASKTALSSEGDTMAVVDEHRKRGLVSEFRGQRVASNFYHSGSLRFFGRSPMFTLAPKIPSVHSPFPSKKERCFKESKTESNYNHTELMNRREWIYHKQACFYIVKVGLDQSAGARCKGKKRYKRSPPPVATGPINLFHAQTCNRALGNLLILPYWGAVGCSLRENCPNHLPWLGWSSWPSQLFRSSQNDSWKSSVSGILILDLLQ